MTYQICPKCEGTGTIWTVSAIQTARCPVCEGKMIISTLTGQPPPDKKPEES